MIESIKKAFPKSKFTLESDGTCTIKLRLNEFISCRSFNNQFPFFVLAVYRGNCPGVFDEEYRIDIVTINEDEKEEFAAKLKHFITHIINSIEAELGIKTHILLPKEQFDNFVSGIFEGLASKEKR